MTTMESFDEDFDLHQPAGDPVPFSGMLHIDDMDESSDDIVNEAAASIKNPNKDDPRRLFQIYKMDFEWDSNIPYSEQPNRLEEEGPTELKFPEHFLEVEGGISLIYWNDDKSNGCLASIKDVDEKEETFTFQIFSWQRKKRRT